MEDLDFENGDLQKIIRQASERKEGVVALITGNHNEITLTPGLPELICELRRESAKDREMIMQILSILEKKEKQMPKK